MAIAGPKEPGNQTAQVISLSLKIYLRKQLLLTLCSPLVWKPGNSCEITWMSYQGAITSGQTWLCRVGRRDFVEWADVTLSSEQTWFCRVSRRDFVEWADVSCWSEPCGALSLQAEIRPQVDPILSEKKRHIVELGYHPFYELLTNYLIFTLIIILICEREKVLK